MPSLQSHLLRPIVKYVVGPGLEKPKTLKAQRRSLDRMGTLVWLPAQTLVQPIETPIKGEWVSAKEAQEQRVILYLHGGGYCLGSPQSHRGIAARISRISQAKVLLLDYPLAPEQPYPSAIENIALAYQWLLDQRYSPNKIVITGDSAGGGLTVAALLALREKHLPLPAAGVCLSPWADLSLSGPTCVTHQQRDPFLNGSWLKLMASHYVGRHDFREPLISPVYANLRGLPPLLIHIGSEEILLSDATRLADHAVDMGGHVTLEIGKGLWHVWQAMEAFLPEGKQAMRQIGNFIQQHTA